MVKFVLVFSHLSGFAGKYIGIDPETIKNAAHKSAITKDFYIRDAKIPITTPTTLKVYKNCCGTLKTRDGTTIYIPNSV